MTCTVENDVILYDGKTAKMFHPLFLCRRAQVSFTTAAFLANSSWCALWSKSRSLPWPAGFAKAVSLRILCHAISLRSPSDVVQDGLRLSLMADLFFIVSRSIAPISKCNQDERNQLAPLNDTFHSGLLKEYKCLN
jgi:hypothetical protein